MSVKISAPFTAEQIVMLNDHQTNGRCHPYTCGKCHSGVPKSEPIGETHREESVLVATRDGWECPYCDYKQTWAIDFEFEIDKFGTKPC